MKRFDVVKASSRTTKLLAMTGARSLRCALALVSLVGTGMLVGEKSASGASGASGENTLNAESAAITEHERVHTSDQDARMAFLESLEGEWSSEADADFFHDGTFSFRVTAGGSAVEERSMAGTPQEMLTVYTMDGADLVGTHYCLMNRHPRVKAAPALVANSLSFVCDGTVANAKSHDEQHIHDWTIEQRADGKVYYTAGMFAHGQRREAPSVLLERR